MNANPTANTNLKSMEEYDELLKKFKATEIEKNKLEREIRSLAKRDEINKLSIETQTGLNKIISDEKIVQEMYVRLLLQSSPVVIFIFDENIKFLLGTNSIRDIVDIDDVSILHGRELDSIIERYRPPAFTEKVIASIKEMKSDNQTRQERIFEIYTEENSYEVILFPFYKDTGEFAGIQVIMHDVTEILNAKEIAEQASRVKSEFLSSMSHEIRTPMNAILGMTEMALQSEKLDDVMEHIHVVKHAGLKLLTIINDILDFSKIERGRLEIIPGDYLLPSLLNDVVSIIRIRAVASKLSFIVDIDSRIPSQLYGDEIRIRQALMNILGNAVKFTKHGFISLVVTREVINDDTINLIMEISDSGVGIKQDDIENVFDAYVQSDIEKNKFVDGTGLGLAITRNIINAMDGEVTVQSEYGKGSTFTSMLPQKIRSQEVLASVLNPKEKSVLIYERRQMYASSIANTIDKLGVRCLLVSSDSEFCEKILSKKWPFAFIAAGLYENVQQVLPKIDFGAKVVLLTEFGEAVPDKSLTTLSMPVHSISIAYLLNGVYDGFAYDENDEPVAAFSAPMARVLFVDDITSNLKVAEGLLAPYKMQVDLRSSGHEAIEAVRERQPDIIFLDHKMPIMDGIETTHRIRALGDVEPYYKNVPIIALTANAVTGIEGLFLKNGFNGFLSKPIDTIRMDSILKKWIPKQKQQIRPAESSVMHDFSNKSTNAGAAAVTQGKASGIGTLDHGVDSEAMRAGLTRLRVALESLDAREIDHCIGYLLKISKMGSISANVKSISEMILIAEYEDAIASVDALLEGN
jgi:signal transduction histidine kinase/CheY-like chemotaxis protein